MGLLDTIVSTAGSQGSGQNAKVAGGMMQALDEHPGGLFGVLEHFRNNGMGDQVQSWASGQEKTATPAQLEQGLGNTGFINQVAAKAGLSPEITKVAMATVLPILISHFTAGGRQAPPQSGFRSIGSEILSKFL